MQPTFKIGDSRFQHSQTQVRGRFVEISSEPFYCIENYDQMPPFFMSVVSHSDHWMFISSTGGLTAGRENAGSAIFPYETEDKIRDSYQNTGPLSIFLVTKGASTFLWEPLSDRYSGIYKIERKIYKNIIGNTLIFEETNLDLQFTFRRTWRFSDRFGFVLTSELQNHSDNSADIKLFSGVQNLLPYGITPRLQSALSILTNAYKRSELDNESGLGIFSLNSNVTDMAEPSESLKATTVWQVGLDQPTYLLSAFQANAFRQGEELTAEEDIRGFRGAYIVSKALTLKRDDTTEWSLVIEVNQDSAAIADCKHMLEGSLEVVKNKLETDIEAGSKALRAIVASADGLQVTNDLLTSAHHYSNVLFNTMRGGIFADNYQVGKADLIDLFQTRNKYALEKHKGFLDSLPEPINLEELLKKASDSNDPNIERLCRGYLPLMFSRRHGDPSRPWNWFSINLKNPDGSQRLDYQGNWRDLFQNWEALACSYPEYVESMISTFVNAGTPDGYNPYRVTRAGIEWEAPEPDNPWANIGYWSDHQIIYLEKLLEISARYHPGKLSELLTKRIFCYVNVPYRQKTYDALVEDPYNTIEFDADAHNRIEEDARSSGNDRKLVRGPDGEIYHVTMNEKLLVFLLAKLVNFIPEGGIWMNTQRPEWNDANNALVGKGLSVVTLSYMLRFVTFWKSLINEGEAATLEISLEVKSLYEAIRTAFSEFLPKLHTSFTDEERRTMMDLLGQAGSDYRWKIYQQGFSGTFESIPAAEMAEFLELTGNFIEHSLRANQRDDGLYHSYNIVELGNRTTKIDHLYEMLEGQVSILSSGLLSPQEGLELLKKLRDSALFRADQHSYILYPDRDVPKFIEKNRIPEAEVKAIDLFEVLIKNKDRSLIIQDVYGDIHFNGDFRNADDVQGALDYLGEHAAYADLVSADGEKILSLFDSIFHHATFTGRSGTFFAFEGLGSIYWHMVSKLLLAAQENIIFAIEQQTHPDTIEGLINCYYDIRKGLGFNKSPEVYGAFPTDPYSHTPKGQGAKQPGMTGQVKEEILTRLIELGVMIRNGQIFFEPALLRQDEYLNEPSSFEYVDLEGAEQQVSLPPGSLAFTFCQTPIVYQLADQANLKINYADGRVETNPDLWLDPKTSQHIFKRDKTISRIDVSFESKNLVPEQF